MSNDTSPKGVRGSATLRRVKTVGGQMEALILKTRLEAEQIPVHLNYDSAGSLYGFQNTGLGAVQVMVPEAFAEAALLICREMEKGETEDA